MGKYTLDSQRLAALQALFYAVAGELDSALRADDRKISMLRPLHEFSIDSSIGRMTVRIDRDGFLGVRPERHAFADSAEN